MLDRKAGTRDPCAPPQKFGTARDTDRHAAGIVHSLGIKGHKGEGGVERALQRVGGGWHDRLGGGPRLRQHEALYRLQLQLFVAERRAQ